MNRKNSIRAFLAGDVNRDWMDFAACQSLDADTSDRLFFLEGKKDPHRIAREWICGRCPVQIDCLEYGNEVAPEFGAWGGIGQAQRRIDRRYRNYSEEELSEEMIEAEK